MRTTRRCWRTTRAPSLCSSASTLPRPPPSTRPRPAPPRRLCLVREMLSGGGRRGPDRAGDDGDVVPRVAGRKAPAGRGALRRVLAIRPPLPLRHRRLGAPRAPRPGARAEQQLRRAVCGGRCCRWTRRRGRVQRCCTGCQRQRVSLSAATRAARGPACMPGATTPPRPSGGSRPRSVQPSPKHPNPRLQSPGPPALNHAPRAPRLAPRGLSGAGATRDPPFGAGGRTAGTPGRRRRAGATCCWSRWWAARARRARRASLRAPSSASAACRGATGLSRCSARASTRRGAHARGSSSPPRGGGTPCRCSSTRSRTSTATPAPP
jgi:hypothetical protein